MHSDRTHTFQPDSEYEETKPLPTGIRMADRFELVRPLGRGGMGEVMKRSITA